MIDNETDKLTEELVHTRQQLMECGKMLEKERERATTLDKKLAYMIDNVYRWIQKWGAEKELRKSLERQIQEKMSHIDDPSVGM